MPGELPDRYEISVANRTQAPDRRSDGWATSSLARPTWCRSLRVTRTPHRSRGITFASLLTSCSGRDGSVAQCGPTRGFEPLLESIVGVLGRPSHRRSTRSSHHHVGIAAGDRSRWTGRLRPATRCSSSCPRTGAISAFRNAQARLVGVSQEPDGDQHRRSGCSVPARTNAGHRVNLLYLVPNFQTRQGCSACANGANCSSGRAGAMC